jgi:hypothetical protein
VIDPPSRRCGVVSKVLMGPIWGKVGVNPQGPAERLGILHFEGVNRSILTLQVRVAKNEFASLLRNLQVLARNEP